MISRVINGLGTGEGRGGTGRDVQVGSVVAFSWKKIVIRKILATVPLVGRVVWLVSHSGDVGVVKYIILTNCREGILLLEPASVLSACVVSRHMAMA